MVNSVYVNTEENNNFGNFLLFDKLSDLYELENTIYDEVVFSRQAVDKLLFYISDIHEFDKLSDYLHEDVEYEKEIWELYKENISNIIKYAQQTIIK